MRRLGETSKDVAKRVRELAAGVTDPSDARAILRYAAWLEARPDSDQVQDLGEQWQEDEQRRG
jgi:hypothetical protein